MSRLGPASLLPRGLARLEPDTLLPSQHTRRGSSSPEVRLLVAVLEAAAHDLHGPDPRAAADAQAWAMADDDPGWPFAFVNVCETLGIAPEQARRRLFRRASRRTWRRGAGQSGLPRRLVSR